jgi:hypothetical protein
VTGSLDLIGPCRHVRMEADQRFMFAAALAENVTVSHSDTVHTFS